ncbi:uncharacterized protein LOC113271932 [Papaver somniferum]|uniref:uncharacterized protein LOC113271932 n=1 Tax=Papaver somniferum TaxID=3469 RepID=UPI000E6F5192|nr:uncharacterized protein LOC113271932 [Papaver somniferum]
MPIALPEHEGEEAKTKALPWEMPKILIDGGSSVEILFYKTFKQMGLKDECLKPSTYNIFGFNGSSTRPRGEITLEIQVGRILILTTFYLVDVLSPYTAIVGRSWVHGIKGVASTYHQRVRFPTPDEVAEIIGDSGEAKYCYKMDVQNGENKVKTQARRARDIDNSSEARDYTTTSDAPTLLYDNSTEAKLRELEEKIRKLSGTGEEDKLAEVISEAERTPFTQELELRAFPPK